MNCQIAAWARQSAYAVAKATLQARCLVGRGEAAQCIPTA